MEDLSEASGLNQRASALDPETVSETDVSHGKHQTDPIQGMSSKAAESGQGTFHRPPHLGYCRPPRMLATSSGDVPWIL